MARNVLAYSDIFNSSGEQLSPEEFVVILSGSQIKFVLAFLESYAHWKSSWTYPTDEQWDNVDAFIAQTYFRLGGEKVYDIANKLGEINTTLQEIRDKMSSGEGDGEGNSIQDLIFWLKILFAVAGGGDFTESTTPLLAQIRDESATANTKLSDQITQFEAMVAKLQGLIDKECQPMVQSVRLDSGVLAESTDLLRNGNWLEGDDNGEPGAFYPDYWLVVGDPESGQFPGRSLISGVQHLIITTETNCLVRQTAIIPPGYELPKVVLSSPAGVDKDAVKISVYVNNDPVTLSVVEDEGNYFEADFNATARDAVKIELSAEGGAAAYFGTLELLVWPTALPISNVVQLPTVGGSMGKGRKMKVQPDKKRWNVITYAGGDTLTNWVIDKIEETADWLSMRLLASSTEDQELQITQEFGLDASVKVCHMNFTMTGSEGSSARVEFFNDGVWEFLRDCGGSGDFSVSIPLQDVGDVGGEKRLRMYLNIYQPIDSVPFDLYNVELELID